MRRKDHNTTERFAMQDPALTSARLFRAMPKNEMRESLKHQAEYGGWQMTFRGPKKLGVTHQSVFFAVLSVLGEFGDVLSPNTSKHHSLLREGLDAVDASELDGGNKAHGHNCHWGYTTLTELARIIGMSNLTAIKRCVEDLSAVTLIAKSNGIEMSQSFLSYIKRGQKLAIAINWRAAAAIAKEAGYTYINLDDRKSLESDASKTLHVWLSTYLRPGKHMKRTVDEIGEYIWGEAANDSTRWRRRKKAMQAVNEIGELKNWDVCQSDVRQALVIKRLA
ncbi:MAG: replication protein C, IncQ-type [Candidatus Thiodiazotropha endolucinida]|nr:hypothetical protein [Candidatus Thiodiazotropha taylori]MCW4262274.1 replication protein C, IncQ-type [Candidatus Thiodiazotropha endolucinida]